MRNSILTAVVALGGLAALLGSAPAGTNADMATEPLLKEALSSATKIEAKEARANALVETAAAQAGMGDLAGAEQTAEMLTDGAERDLAYARVARAEALSGDIERARGLLDHVSQGGRAAIYLALAEGQLKKGDITGAKDAASRISVSFLAAHASESIALAQAASGDFGAAKETIAGIKEPGDVIVDAYVELAILEHKAKKEDEVGQAMGLARTAAKNVKFMELLASIKLVVGDIETGAGLASAKRLLEETTDPADKALVLGQIVDAQIAASDIAGAKETAGQLKGPADRIFAYASLAGAEAKRGGRDAAKQWVDNSVALLASVEQPGNRGLCAASIAAAMADAEGAAAAAEWARAQADPIVRARALLGIVGELSGGRVHSGS